MSLANTKRKMVVAGIRGLDGSYVRIPIVTSADIVHVIALAMGYKPEIAFSFGVISRSIPAFESGEMDVNLEGAKKTIQIAALINQHRAEGTLPDDIGIQQQLLVAIKHVRAIESCYSEMISLNPEILTVLAKEYSEWSRGEVKQTLISRVKAWFRCEKNT